VLITDNGMHFIGKKLKTMLRKYKVYHKYGFSYCLQTSGQVDISNCEIKAIIQKTIARSKKEYVDKLDTALWAYCTTFKTPIGTTPFRLIYGKPCHLLVKLEHKAYWAVKHVNFDLKSTWEK